MIHLPYDLVNKDTPSNKEMRENEKKDKTVMIMKNSKRSSRLITAALNSSWNWQIRNKKKRKMCSHQYSYNKWHITTKISLKVKYLLVLILDQNIIQHNKKDITPFQWDQGHPDYQWNLCNSSQFFLLCILLAPSWKHAIKYHIQDRLD